LRQQKQNVLQKVPLQSSKQSIVVVGIAEEERMVIHSRKVAVAAEWHGRKALLPATPPNVLFPPGRMLTQRTEWKSPVGQKKC
jgi:hypothetical protein